MENANIWVPERTFYDLSMILTGIGCQIVRQELMPENDFSPGSAHSQGDCKDCLFDGFKY